MGDEKTSAQTASGHSFTTLAVVGSVGELLVVLRRFRSSQRIRIAEFRYRIIDGMPEIRMTPMDDVVRRAREIKRNVADQKKRVADGRCGSCGAARDNYATFCNACAIRDRERRRKRTGCKPWRKGSPGRQPKVEKIY